MPASEQLHSLNQMIEQFVAGLHAGSSVSGPALTSIFEGMCQMAPFLADRSWLEDAQVGTEINSYRQQLCALQNVLPAIEGLLLAEKARLQVKRSHLQSAAEWLAGSKQTL
jgi:hypothetical protein